MVRIKDEIIPVIPIDRIFELPGEEYAEISDLLVIVELEQKFKALPVRRVVDRREIVVKSARQ